MAKLVYGPHYGTITVYGDSEALEAGDIEITSEQARAIAAWQTGQALRDIRDALEEIAFQPPREVSP